ncbi:MAG: polysaccharide export protein [Alphaproteobacteria bacterium]|nr:polysaccharide export protein [Alphaproteobacteria bacterium]
MLPRLLFRALVAVVLAGLVAACSGSGSLRSAYDVATGGPYRLDTDDVLRVTVYGETDLTNTYRIDDRGYISFPLTGPIEVRGVTTQVVASRLTSALADGYLRNPNVAVEVSTYRPFFIQGEVATPGNYPFVYGMTARSAVSTAGGFTETANRDRVVIYRRQGTRMIKGGVDLDFPIYPGDTIVVEDRWF